MTEPKLLLLDEPTEVQPSIIQEIEEVIARIKAQGQVTILLVEQYLEFAWRLADAFYMMEKGSIVAHGDIADLHEDVVSYRLGSSLASPERHGEVAMHLTPREIEKL